VRLRSPLDAAIPALGALAAEPLYVLVDTAVVGHLGRAQLAALGLSASVLGVVAVFNFLAYGTTAHVARAHGAGEWETAARLGVQALWLSIGIGVVFALVLLAGAPAIVAAMGAEGATARCAEEYLRIVALGVPSVFVAMGGQGYLRGIADLRTPLVIIAAGNTLNVVLNVALVYGVGLGIRGSAAATATGQTCMGVAFVWRVLRGHGLVPLVPALARRLLGLGGHIFVRTTVLVAAFVVAGAVVTRIGDASLGAHQVGFQLWLFLGLVLDAIAIAGQILVGRALGAGRAEDAFEASVRMIRLSVLAGLVFAGVLLALGDVLPRAFTGDAAVLERVDAIWPLFALMQPLNGAAFALDGILIGAGDGRYLMWAMVGASLLFVALLLAVHAAGLGLVGVWAALLVFIGARAALLGVRFAGRRWAITGWM
jgi:putative MATE family efflux protein